MAKILILGPFLDGWSLNFSAGGKEKVTVDNILALKKLNHEVLLLPTPWSLSTNSTDHIIKTKRYLISGEIVKVISSFRPNKTKIISLVIHKIFGRKISSNMIIEALFDSQKTLIDTVNAEKPDVIINHQVGFDIPQILLKQTKIVLYYHTNIAIQKGYHFYILPSHFMSKKLLNHGYSNKHVIYAPVVIDNKIISLRDFNKILFVSNVNSEKRKGLPILMESMRVLLNTKPNLKLVILGLEKEYFMQKYSTYSELFGNIECLGPLENSEIIKLMSQVGLLVIPSKSESWGIAYIEALCMGTFVLGFKDTINEIQDFSNMYVGSGFVNRENNHVELSQLISDIISNDCFYSIKYRKKLIDFFTEKFSKLTYEKEMDKFIKKILN